MSVRVRFSPAPTGSLHVGSARTALFNWLFARHHGGVFALRIEDTDRARSRDEWVTGIQDVLRWLGLDWDEGPILQSERFDEYRAAAEDLVQRGLAYECSCTEEELTARGDAARAAGRTPGYDGQCRDLTPEARAARAAEGRPRTIRFRTPDTGVSRFDDAIRGEIAVEWSTVPDFVIVRSDGNPIFFLANAVDDLAMEITHVIRGEDLLDSTLILIRDDRHTLHGAAGGAVLVDHVQRQRELALRDVDGEFGHVAAGAGFNGRHVYLDTATRGQVSIRGGLKTNRDAGRSRRVRTARYVNGLVRLVGDDDQPCCTGIGHIFFGYRHDLLGTVQRDLIDSRRDLP